MDIYKYKPNGTPWSFIEDEQLNKMYNEELIDINEISSNLNRTPGSIISRLCKNKHIPNRTSARGYMVYRNSELYRSIVSSGEGRKINKQPTNTNDNISINITGINNYEYLELKNDVKEIKNDIKNLNNAIKELVEMMKAVYEFENS